jgi:hypothetical protein
MVIVLQLTHTAIIVRTGHVIHNCKRLTVGWAGLELCSCLTFTLPDPVLHGTIDCYIGNHLVTNRPFFYNCLFLFSIATANCNRPSQDPQPDGTPAAPGAACTENGHVQPIKTRCTCKQIGQACLKRPANFSPVDRQLTNATCSKRGCTLRRRPLHEISCSLSGFALKIAQNTRALVELSSLAPHVVQLLAGAFLV